MAKKRRKFTQCPNCGYTFEEVNNYCPNCGQENHDLNVSVKHLAEEFLEGTLHYDNKFWVTLKYLLFKPGLLTEKFNIGKRASYVPPFRLYVFVSILFFTALALRSSNSKMVMGSEEAQQELRQTDPEAAAQLQQADSLTATTLNRLGQQRVSAVQTTGISNEFVEKFKRFTQDEEQSRQKILKNTSFMMFVLMPFFGFILYLFYYKQRRNYVEHLMFSIHFHTFFFLITILALATEFIFKGFDVDNWVFWISAIYLFFALKRVYKESYLRTSVKFFPISIVYLLSLLVLFVSTVAISVLLS
ncbi:DUF3667 domain-containing protein [uncultured Pontibacter sp.]|uniref:DUF3667 domain-containing protein n=1 Tax=uncultured Pontibacter sp. TaxID=453356 RepID=UPI00262BC94B|nr:DUF3667 domain-containing protein [uncultured Pontibacter sp.]